MKFTMILTAGLLAAAGMVQAETLTVSSDTTIDADASYDGIVFTAGAKLSGSGKITLGSAGIQVSSGTATIESAIEFDGADQQAITVAKGATLNLNGVLSGAAPLAIDGAGTTILAGANTFTGTMRLMGGGIIYVRNDYAFGTTDAQTIIEATDTHGVPKVYFGTADISEPFDFYFKDSVSVINFEKNAKTVFRGKIQKIADKSIGSSKTARLNLTFAANNYLVLSNSWDFGYTSFYGKSDTTVEFWEPISLARCAFSYGTYLFHSSVNVNSWNTGYGINPSNGSLLKMFTNDVFCTECSPSTVSVGALLRMTNAKGIFDLNGFDQTILAIYGDCLGTIKSDEPAMLSLAGTTTTDLDTTVSVPFAGKVGLTLARQSTKKTLAMTLTGASTSTGDLVVSNGCALALGSSGSWAGTNIVVSGEGSTLTLNNKDNLTAEENVTVSILNAGKLSLNYSGSKVITKLFADGGEYTAAGVYGKDGVSGVTQPIDCIDGTGTLTILPSGDGKTCTWMASPEATDTSVATAANWQNGTAPDFAKGTDKAVFTASGAGNTATIDTAATFGGVTLTRPADDSFSFSGSGSLSLGVDGLAVTAPADGVEARTFTNDVPTTLAYPQTWTLPGVGTAFYQRAPLSATENVTMTLEGASRIHLAGDNSNFSGTLQLEVPENGTGTYVYVENANALRHANVVVNMAKTTEEKYGFRIDIAKGLTNVIGGDVTFDFNHTDTYSAMVFNKYSSTTFEGKVKTSYYDRCGYEDYSRVVYAGGYESSGIRSSLGGGSTIVFEQTPATIGHLSISTYANTPSKVEIRTERNVFNSTSWGLDLIGNIIIDCHAEYALITNLVAIKGGYRAVPRFYYRSNGSNGYYRPELRLNGFDQSIGHILRNPADAEVGNPALVSSESGAQLHVYQDIAGTAKFLAFTGGAGLTLSGPKELQLLDTPNSTTGRLEVVGGNLTLGASWSNATAVVVREKGTLTLQESNLFGKTRTEMSLESGSTLSLGGTDQLVMALMIDGEDLPVGVYHADDAVLKGIVTGEGSITVRGRRRGFTLFIQ